MTRIQSNKQGKIEPGLSSMLKKDIPLIDLRSPDEFEKGAFPTSCNLPILSDEERKQVGLTYKKHGSQAAEELGYKLVSGDIRARRIQAWQQFIQRNPEAHLYCWRGGMRSAIASRWLKGTGLNIPVVPGGYKALRRTCLEILESVKNDRRRWVILGGRTGTGKTVLIRNLDFTIDLEHLANHRGSAFGRQQTPQPTAINFENTLAIAYLKHIHDMLVLEDESRGIGKLTIPETWYQRMQTAELIILTVPMTERIENIRQEYVDSPLRTGFPPEALKIALQDSLLRIKNRLGGKDYKLIHQKIENAFQTLSGESHEDWIHDLLKKYYDPMYSYQLKQKKKRCVLEGDGQAIRNFLRA